MVRKRRGFRLHGNAVHALERALFAAKIVGSYDEIKAFIESTMPRFRDRPTLRCRYVRVNDLTRITVVIGEYWEGASLYLRQDTRSTKTATYKPMGETVLVCKLVISKEQRKAPVRVWGGILEEGQLT